MDSAFSVLETRRPQLALEIMARKLEDRKTLIEQQLIGIHSAIKLFKDSEEEIVAGYHPASHAKELTDAIENILETHGPLHRNEILVKVRERGIHVGGDRPINNIGAYLSTDNRFKNVGKGLWDLVKYPFDDGDGVAPGYLRAKKKQDSMLAAYARQPDADDPPSDSAHASEIGFVDPTDPSSIP